ncbi:MAG TPA: hypothetical protein VFW46_05035 [Stellaceae bacterium]|nr:hypothetical protein [Stellaceae bacterium]
MERFNRRLKSAPGRDYIAPAMAPKKPETDPPICCAPTKIESAISDAIIAYSIALTPEAERIAAVSLARIGYDDPGELLKRR